MRIVLFAMASVVAMMPCTALLDFGADPGAGRPHQTWSLALVLWAAAEIAVTPLEHCRSSSARNSLVAYSFGALPERGFDHRPKSSAFQLTHRNWYGLTSQTSRHAAAERPPRLSTRQNRRRPPSNARIHEDGADHRAGLPAPKHIVPS